MRTVLAIEISNPSAWSESASARPGVAVGRLMPAGVELIGTESIDPTRVHDDDLMPAVERLFRAHGISARDIHRIAVSVGPGGFTATRIAVTSAKLMAEALGAVCVAVPSAAVAHASAQRANRCAGDVLVALASKGESMHISRFSPDGAAGDTPRVMNAAEVELSGVELALADRFVPPAFRERVHACGARCAEPVFDPAALLAIEYRFEACDPVDLAPIYPREPEAVTKWRELKRTGRK